MSAGRRKCQGPVYYADQGIEVCTVCGGCICCDHSDVDHDNAERECFPSEADCSLRDHTLRPCHGDLRILGRNIVIAAALDIAHYQGAGIWLCYHDREEMDPLFVEMRRMAEWCAQLGG